jgi:uncharacterized protein (DUF1778 family)
MTIASGVSTQIVVPLSAPHRELIEQAAVQSGRSLDGFVAWVLVERAQQVLQAANQAASVEAEAQQALHGQDANGALPAAGEQPDKRQGRSGERLKKSKHVILDDLALIGWHHLPRDAQKQIRRTLDTLAAHPPADWPSGIVEPWRPAEQIYVLHTLVGLDHLLVLFRPEGDCIRLLHLVLKETIDRYFTPKNGA